MQELIKITTKVDQQLVSARELYNFLGYEPAHWKRWYMKNILQNQFMVAGVDYEGFTIGVNGNQTWDFTLTIDFAKRLSMMAKTQKGEKVRNYFIECERKSKGVESFGLPHDYKSAVKALLQQIEINEKVEERLQEVQPKVDFYDKVAESGDAVSMDKAAQLLKTGRNRLFNELRAKQIMKPNSTTPYQKYVDAGYFVLIEKPWTHEKSGETRISITTQVTQKGIQYINKHILA